ncbi:MAG: tetratricopeptide repeat protein [Planctomycetes bacterium]|nr:tetratricopeptide repeat protein [Planctomycetota bacterium]
MAKARKPKAGSKRRARHVEDASASTIVQEPVATYGAPTARVAGELPPELAPHAGELNRMAAFVDLAEGFRLAFAECNFAPLRKAIIEELRRRCEPDVARLCVIDLTDADDMLYPLQAIARRVPRDGAAEGAPKRVLMFLGLEAHVHITDPQPGVLVALNMARDAFPARIPEPMIFWLPEYLLTTLSRVAHDFWSWANATFRFPAPQAFKDIAFRETVGADTRILDTQVAETKARVRVLEGLLQEYLPSVGDSAQERLPAALDVLNELGVGYWRLGQDRQAMAYWSRMLAIARRAKSLRAEGAALGNLGGAYVQLGDMRKGVECAKQQLRVARKMRDRRGEGNALGILGIACSELGQTRKAIELYERALKIATEIGDRRNEGVWLGNLGIAYAALGETQKAMDCQTQELKIAIEMGDRRSEGGSLANLGIRYADSGDLPKATWFFMEALQLAREIGDRRTEANASWNLGVACEKEGHLALAVGLMQMSVDYEREEGHADAEKHAAEVEALRRRMKEGVR